MQNMMSWFCVWIVMVVVQQLWFFVSEKCGFISVMCFGVVIVCWKYGCCDQLLWVFGNSGVRWVMFVWLLLSGVLIDGRNCLLVLFVMNMWCVVGIVNMCCVVLCRLLFVENVVVLLSISCLIVLKLGCLVIVGVCWCVMKCCYVVLSIVGVVVFVCVIDVLGWLNWKFCMKLMLVFISVCSVLLFLMFLVSIIVLVWCSIDMR